MTTQPIRNPEPKFTVPTWLINKLDPWKGTDSEGTEFHQLYVTRDMMDVECVAEVKGWPWTNQEPEIGDCFDLRGRQIILTLEESAQALSDWEDWMATRAEKEERENAHAAEY